MPVLDQLAMIRDMTKALGWLTDEQIEVKSIRTCAYLIANILASDDIARLDAHALVGARAYRMLYPAKTIARAAA